MRWPLLLTVTTREPVDRQHVVQQQTGEREVAEMVGAELQLEAVLGGLALSVYITPALLISRSMRGCAARSSSAALRMLSSDVRSSCCSATTAFGLAALILSAASLPLSRLRTASTTCAPLPARTAAAS